MLKFNQLKEPSNQLSLLGFLSNTIDGFIEGAREPPTNSQSERKADEEKPIHPPPIAKPPQFVISYWVRNQFISIN